MVAQNHGQGSKARGGRNKTSYTTVRLVTFQYTSQSQFRQDQCAPLQQPENKSCWGLLRYCAPYEYARHSAPHHQLALTRTSTRMSVSTQETRHPRALVRTIWEQAILQATSISKPRRPGIPPHNSTPHLRRKEEAERLRRDEKKKTLPGPLMDATQGCLQSAKWHNYRHEKSPDQDNPSSLEEPHN